MLSIYVLECVRGKYYVGKTSNLNYRMLSHFSGQGSVWTKKYRPIRIAQVIENADKFDEDAFTLRYMELYGISNVRGGYYSKVQLSADDLEHIKSLFDGVNDHCFRCSSDHFANKCPISLNEYNQLNNGQTLEVRNWNRFILGELAVNPHWFDTFEW